MHKDYLNILYSPPVVLPNSRILHLSIDLGTSAPNAFRCEVGCTQWLRWCFHTLLHNDGRFSRVHMKSDPKEKRRHQQQRLPFVLLAQNNFWPFCDISLLPILCQCELLWCNILQQEVNAVNLLYANGGPCTHYSKRKFNLSNILLPSWQFKLILTLFYGNQFEIRQIPLSEFDLLSWCQVFCRQLWVTATERSLWLAQSTMVHKLKQVNLIMSLLMWNYTCEDNIFNITANDTNITVKHLHLTD